MTDATTTAPPTLARRFLALMIDWLLCLLIAGFFANPMRVGWPPVAILIAEYGFFVGIFGQTIGMRLTGLGCVDVRTGRPIGIPRATLRGVLLALVIPALIMDERRRGLHDRAVGSEVVTTS